VRDLGANGTYLVFRQIEQDVARFWNALDRATQGDAKRREWLAAKVVGRWPIGAPFTLQPDARTDPSPNKDDPSNDFSYRPADADGVACPLGAHIRRANPRDTLGNDPAVALTSARRHRLLRRGRAYGLPLVNRLTDDGKERGLHFVCLNANLERQFEFVQQTWINKPDI
jgi:deferrochelatase/peroxidase EfeB